MVAWLLNLQRHGEGLLLSYIVFGSLGYPVPGEGHGKQRVTCERCVVCNTKVKTLILMYLCMQCLSGVDEQSNS